MAELGNSAHIVMNNDNTKYSVLHVRLEFKFHEMLFVLVVCDVALQCHSEPLNR